MPPQCRKMTSRLSCNTVLWTVRGLAGSSSPWKSSSAWHTQVRSPDGYPSRSKRLLRLSDWPTQDIGRKARKHAHARSCEVFDETATNPVWRIADSFDLTLPGPSARVSPVHRFVKKNLSAHITAMALVAALAPSPPDAFLVCVHVRDNVCV
jgi:hypothetical protein